jgi:hypothetical protein
MLHRSLNVVVPLAFGLTLLLVLTGVVKAVGPRITQADCCPVEITEPGTYSLGIDATLFNSTDTPAIHIHDVSNVIFGCEFGGPLARGALQNSSIQGPGRAVPSSVGILVERAGAVGEQIVVQDCAVTDFNEGIAVKDSVNVLIRRNRVERNKADGIDFDNVHISGIESNFARANEEDGIDIDRSNFIALTSNTATANAANGFDVSNSDNLTFTLNASTNNGQNARLPPRLDQGFGFFLFRANDNLFMSNRTGGNRRQPFLQQESVRNSFMGNIFP